MPKTLLPSMEAHLQQETTSLCTCWILTRTDGRIFRFTDHDSDISFGGDLYEASSTYSRTSMSNESGFGIDDLEITAILASDKILESELSAGLFDYAAIRLFMVDFTDPDGNGDIKLRAGWLGEILTNQQGTAFRTELRGLTQALSFSVLEVFSPDCRADLGDDRCKFALQKDAVWEALTPYAVGDIINVATDTPVVEGDEILSYENRWYQCTVAGTSSATQPAFDRTLGASTVDATVTWLSLPSQTITAEVLAVTNLREFTIQLTTPTDVLGVGDFAFADGYLDGGVVTWISGDNDGRSTEVKEWTSASSTIALHLPMAELVQVGDKLSVYAGCDKQVNTCQAKFNNVLNFRGEPHLPGQASLTNHPVVNT